MDETKIQRDKSSSAVVNTDFEGLAAYKARRYSKDKMTELETDINSVKQELTDIKNMLQLLIANRG
jgi:hypothetical protein